jgi:hypothetical protein
MFFQCTPIIARAHVAWADAGANYPPAAPPLARARARHRSAWLARSPAVLTTRPLLAPGAVSR